MKTLIILAGVVAVIALIAVAVNVNVRLSAGSYDPETEARAAVIREMSPRATAQALDHARALAAIKEQEAQESAVLAMSTRRNLFGIATVAAGGLTGLTLGALAGLVAWLVVNVTRRAQAPAVLAVNHLVIVRSGAELRVIDSMTGAAWSLLADRQPDRLRAESMARIELAGALAQRGHDGIEILPAAIPQAILQESSYEKV